MEKIFFAGWESLARTAIVCVLGYGGIVFLLRLSGKRTLSKMNAFDFIVTIALGSTLASMILTKATSLADGFTAIGLLIGLQYSVTYFSVRSKRFSDVIKSQPVLLLYKGNFINSALVTQRITREEILSKIREKGNTSVEDIDFIIMETDSSISVIPKSAASVSALQNVKGTGNI